MIFFLTASKVKSLWIVSNNDRLHGEARKYIGRICVAIANISVYSAKILMIISLCLLI